MLSIETEIMISSFLAKLAEGELEVERSRQRLASQSFFNAYSTFDLLDRLSIRSISIHDLTVYLLKNGIYCKKENLQLLIKQYDSNNDGRLSLPDYFRLVLPSESYSLRDQAQINRCRLTLEVERMLARHLELEVNVQIDLENSKRCLRNRFDFSEIAVFQALDTLGTGSISIYQIEKFMTSKGFLTSNNQLSAIIRRIDTDGDMRLGYQEFIEGLTENLSRLRVFSPRTQDFRTQASSPTSSYTSAQRYASSPQQVASQQESRSTSRYTSPQRYSPSSRYSPHSQRTSPEQSCTNPFPPSSPVRTQLFPPSSGEITQIVLAFKTQIGLARDLEEAKQNLSIQPDLTILDLFRLIDLNGKGYLLASDLTSLLNDLGVLNSTDDVYLIMRRYGTDYILRFTDFQDMWLPKENYSRRLITQRPHLSVAPLNRMTAFSQKTLDKIASTLKLCIQVERFSERLRQEISSKRWINLYQVFQHIDLNEDGFISIHEFADLLRENGVYASHKDLEALVETYDKNLDGRVSYSEFIQEITPRIN